MERLNTKVHQPVGSRLFEPLLSQPRHEFVSEIAGGED